MLAVKGGAVAEDKVIIVVNIVAVADLLLEDLINAQEALRHLADMDIMDMDMESLRPPNKSRNVNSFPKSRRLRSKKICTRMTLMMKAMMTARVQTEMMRT